VHCKILRPERFQVVWWCVPTYTYNPVFVPPEIIHRKFQPKINNTLVISLLYTLLINPLSKPGVINFHVSDRTRKGIVIERYIVYTSVERNNNNSAGDTESDVG